jgi:hypothetical protein
MLRWPCKEKHLCLNNFEPHDRHWTIISCLRDRHISIYAYGALLEPQTRFELVTYWLQISCTANCASVAYKCDQYFQDIHVYPEYLHDTNHLAVMGLITQGHTFEPCDRHWTVIPCLQDRCISIYAYKAIYFKERTWASWETLNSHLFLTKEAYLHLYLGGITV